MRASETGRSVICPASLTLPRSRVRPLKTEQAAEYGTLVHHWKETGEIAGWGSEADKALLAKKLAATRIGREEWWGGGSHEETYALNLITLAAEHYTGPRDGADDWKSTHDPAEWLTGTADYLMCHDYGCWIDDLKTSRWPQNPNSAQMKSYHLMVWVHGGCQTPWECTSSITQWPKYKITDQPVRHWGRVMGPLDLLEHLDDLQWSLANPNLVRPTPEGCKFCDSEPECPNPWRTP